MRLLVTRPAPDNERTAAKLRELGHEVDLAPLLRIEPVDNPVIGGGPWAGLVLTSANAARVLSHAMLRGKLLNLPIFAVGRRTAEAARAAGFPTVISADGDASDLVALIEARGAGPSPLLYLAGEDQATDIATELATHGIGVTTVIVYRAVAATALPPATRAAILSNQINGVLHYSRRSAQAFVDCARQGGILDEALSPSHYCLSEQVAGPLREAGAKGLRIAAKPEENALLALLSSG